jgi:hypothetical protein
MPTENEMFLYLDELRESGAVNMFGARPHLIEAFSLSKADAGAVLSKWMQTFSQRHPKGV